MTQKSITSFFSDSLNFNFTSTTSSAPATTEETISDAEEVHSGDEIDEVFSVSDKENLSENQIQSPRKRKFSHKKPGGGQSRFLREYVEKFRDHFIEASSKSNGRSETSGKNNNKFFCKACGQHYNLSRSGEKAIQLHIESTKHIRNLANFNSNAPILPFINRRTANEEKRGLAAELVIAFHSARHNFSMNSANCTSKLIPVLFEGCSSAENFASARDKTTAIVNGVLNQFLKERFLDELRQAGGHFSIGIDATPMNEKRYYAIVIRYFHNGTKTKLLELLCEPSEKADEMTRLIKETLSRNNLELGKMASLTADNTNSNFGGLARKGKGNLYYKLKQGHKYWIF